MASLRKANAYSKRKVVPFTRVSRRKGKAYIKAVPPKKVIKYNMGKEALLRAGKLPHHLTLVADENVQIRQNAFEACRQFINKKLDKGLSGQYFFKIIPFAHHIQRENRMLTGAGADRMQTGMQLSYGKAVNKSAIMKENGKLFFVAVQTPKAVQVTRQIFKQIKSKLPCKTKVLYEIQKV